MTAVVQLEEGEIASDSTQKSIASQATASKSGGSPSDYAVSDSTSTYPILNVAVSLDEIDRAIDTDFRVIARVGQLTGSGSVGSQFIPRGPRGQHLRTAGGDDSLGSIGREHAPKHLSSNTLPHRMYERAREGKDSVIPFVGRQPDMTRTSSMILVRTGAEEYVPREIKSRFKSDLLTSTSWMKTMVWIIWFFGSQT